MADILKIRAKRIKKLLPDWTRENQNFDLRICPDCETLQLKPGKVIKDGAHCDNPDCQSEIHIYTRKGKHQGEFIWTNENWG